MKRNTIVLSVVLFILAIFAWAGWANWKYRQQAAERALASAAKGELVADASGNAPQYVSPLKGKPAPDFTLQDLSGKKVSLADFKGKAVLINFWATWCGPCKVETPWLVELRNQYAAKGFEVLGISAEGDDLQPGDKEGWAKDKAAIAKFVKEEKMPYPVLITVTASPGLRRDRCHANVVLCGPERKRGQCAVRPDVKRRDGSQHPQIVGRRELNPLRLSAL